MALTFEITFVDEETLDRLDDDDDDRLRSIMFEEDRPTVSLGRAWHMIHALLAGDVDAIPGPEGFIRSGGRPVGSDEGGGRMRAFAAEEVAAIQKVLPSAEELLGRYQNDGMPDAVQWRRRLATEGPEYFLEVYRDLLPAIAKAVEEDLGMLAGLV